MFVVLCIKFIVELVVTKNSMLIYCFVCPKKEKRKKPIFNRKIKRMPNLGLNGKTYNCPKIQIETNRMRIELKKAKKKKENKTNGNFMKIFMAVHKYSKLERYSTKPLLMTED